MRVAACLLLNIVLGFVAAPTLAAGQVQEEVLVTGSLIHASEEAPHITLIRRADNLITDVRVVCDTRDDAQRREELRNTLRNMIRASTQAQNIELGLSDDNIVGAFNETMLDAVIHVDTKPDTSVATLTIKTKVSQADTFDAAAARITGFIERTPKVGRSEILRIGNWNLTLIGPELSRPALLQLIAKDSQATAGAFGPNYQTQIDNLQLPIAWYRSGPLDLALFIPYTLHVAPPR